MPVSCLLTPDALAQRRSPDGLDHEIVVTVVGELDLSMEPDLAEVVVQLRTLACGPVSIVIDLSEVTFIDVAGVRTLRRAVSHLEQDQARPRLIGVRRSIARVFDLIGASDLLALADCRVPV